MIKCSCYDGYLKRCNGTKERDLCDCNGDRRACNFYSFNIHKMDEKEAIERLKDHFRIHDDGRPTPYLDEAVSIVIAATELQVEKKVKYLNRHGEGYDSYNEDYYNCPSCGRRLRNKQHDKHCGSCGQALDWEVGDNE